MALELRLRRRFDAPAELIWDGLTRPEALEQWFWPARFHTKAAADVRVGGQFRLDGTSAGIAASGRYIEVEQPRRLSFTWRWDGEQEQTVVTVQIAESDGGAEVDLAHSGFATEAVRDDHIVGWSDCLARLPAWLAER